MTTRKGRKRRSNRSNQPEWKEIYSGYSWLTDAEHVLVDVGTGFYVEKSTDEAQKFYASKIEELGGNIKDLESIVNGKANNLRVVEEVLRQKMLLSQQQGGEASSEAT